MLEIPPENDYKSDMQHPDPQHSETLSETSFFERSVEGFLVLSRWLLTPIFVGLIAILLVMIYKFYGSIFYLFSEIAVIEKKKVMLTVLEMIDFALITSLVVMVAISGYENFISSTTDGNQRKGKPTIFSELDPGKIKVKLSMSIIAISSIRLLQMYMEIDPAATAAGGLMWYVIIHITFLVSGMTVTLIEKLSAKKKKDPAKDSYGKDSYGKA